MGKSLRSLALAITMACGFIWNGEAITQSIPVIGLGRFAFVGVVTLMTIAAWVGLYRLIVHSRELGTENQRAIKVLELALLNAVTLFSWMNLVSHAGLQ